MIKVIALDYDDTLVKSSEALHLADSKTVQALGIKPSTKEKYFSVYGKTHEEMTKLLYPDLDVETYFEQYKKTYKPSLLKLFPGVRELLKKIAQKNIELAVLSTKDKEFLEESLAYNKITIYISYIHSAESSKFIKPDPRVFDNLIKDFAIAPSEILYVGDSTKDFLAASKAGLQFVAVTTGINSKEDFEKLGCKNIIGSIKELNKYF